MEQTKKTGRPPLGGAMGERQRFPAYGDASDMERLRALADRWRCSRSAAIRRAVMEAAKRERLGV